jgi:hypothetical protein
MPVQFTFDRTGFPLLRLPHLRLDVHLLPVTKLQFEQFLATEQGYGDRWYEQLLNLNPRVSYHDFPDPLREQLFLTGILPPEAERFALWLGDGFGLPTAEQWGRIFGHLERRKDAVKTTFQAIRREAASAPRHILQRLAEQIGDASPQQQGLWIGGVVEWVAGLRAGWAGLGAPRPQFYPNLFRPPADLVRPISGAERQKQFGFRLIRWI